jgi:hypothetical protein
MTGILVALLVIVTAALCFLLGIYVGAGLIVYENKVDEAEAKERKPNERPSNKVNESRF